LINIYYKSYYPTNEICLGLFGKKGNELESIINKESIQCETHINSLMRKTIWEYCNKNSELSEIEVSDFYNAPQNLDKNKGGGKGLSL